MTQNLQSGPAQSDGVRSPDAANPEKAKPELLRPDTGGPGAGPRIHRLLAYRVLLFLAVLVFGLDQLTKSWINAHLQYESYGPTGRTIIPGFFNLVHVGNTGAAWSMFTGRSTVLALLAVATLIAIFMARRQLGLKHPAVQVAFGLLSGGIVGNLTDRLVHGHVIDFIDLHFGTYVYPTFNVADSAICIGVIWYMLWSLRHPTPA